MTIVVAVDGSSGRDDDAGTEDPSHPLLTSAAGGRAAAAGGAVAASSRSGAKGGATAAGARSGRGSIARGGSVARESGATTRGGGKKGSSSAKDYGISRDAVPPSHAAAERLFAKATTVFPASAILDIFVAQVRGRGDDGGGEERRAAYASSLRCGGLASSLPAVLRCGTTFVPWPLPRQFIGKVRGNKHLTRLHIHAAGLKSDALAVDIRFFIYQWNRQRGEQW